MSVTDLIAREFTCQAGENGSYFSHLGRDSKDVIIDGDFDLDLVAKASLAPEMLELLARCRYYLGRNESSSAASLLCEIEAMIDRVTR